MKSADKKKLEDFYKIFKPQLFPQKMLKMGVFGGAYFSDRIKEYPKSWFKNAKLSKTFDVEKNRLKLKQVYQEKNGRTKDGFIKKILLVGFSGIADLLMEDEFPRLMRFKLKDGKLLKDM